jgi:hypothetical protein
MEKINPDKGQVWPEGHPGVSTPQSTNAQLPTIIPQPFLFHAPHPLFNDTDPFSVHTDLSMRVPIFSAALSSRPTVPLPCPPPPDKNTIATLLHDFIPERDDYNAKPLFALSTFLDADVLHADMNNLIMGFAHETDGDHLFDFVDSELHTLSLLNASLEESSTTLPSCAFSIARCNFVIESLTTAVVVDTGAGPSFVSPEFVEYITQHSKNIHGRSTVKIERSPNPVKVRSANGECTLASEIATLDILLGTKHILHRFIVFPGLPESVLLGNDFFRTHKAIVDYNKEHVSFPRFSVSLPFIECTQVNRDAPSSVALTTIETITLPPFHEVKLEVQTPSNVGMSAVSLCLGLVQSSDRSVSKLECVAAKAFSPLRYGHTCMLLTNVSEQQVVIPAGTVVACFTPMKKEGYEFYSMELEDESKLVSPPHVRDLSDSELDQLIPAGIDLSKTVVHGLELHSSKRF